jgi:hypothetical protein
MLVIDAEMAPSNVNAGRAIVKAEVARLRRVPIPLAEWNAARKRLLSSSAVTDPSVGAEIARIQNIADHHLPLDYYARLAGVYKATPQDGLRAAHTYLTDAFAEVIVAQHRRGRAGLFHAAPISARQTCLKPYVNVN